MHDYIKVAGLGVGFFLVIGGILAMYVILAPVF